MPARHIDQKDTTGASERMRGNMSLSFNDLTDWEIIIIDRLVLDPRVIGL